MGQDGQLLATASTKGTLVRIFNTADGTLLQEVRRGADRAEIYSLAFSSTAQWLAVSSDKGTVHVFSLKINPGSPGTDKSHNTTDSNAASTSSTSSLSFFKGVLPKYFSSEWSVAQFRLVEGSQYIVAFGHQKNTVPAVSADPGLGCRLISAVDEMRIMLHAFGQVPVLEDGDLTLFESRAISTYVAEKFKETGYDLTRQQNLQEAALVKVWMEVESQQFCPAIAPIVYQFYVDPLKGVSPDQAMIDVNLEKLGKVLDIYEARLSSTKYLAGDFYSLADLHHIPCTHYLMKTPAASVINERPHVKAWWEDISSRPASKKTAEDEELVSKAEAKLRRVLDVYEARLTKFKYLASDKYTVVDVLHLPNLHALMGTQAKKLIDSRPRVSAWCSDPLARPAWAKVLEMQLKESRAIIRYISHQYLRPGKEQVFEEPKLQGIAATWIDVEDHHFDPPASKLAWELFHKPKNGLATDNAVVEEEEAKLVKVLDVYEERLKDCKYLGGDKFTSADLPLLHFLMGIPAMKKLFDERPRVSAWCSAIPARPAWAKVVDMIQSNEI
ncbi:hypothetical protein GH714_023765 [Hevea brasiliensis]|uniref:glutathione transferase n=1 Tax=Hevea brasiliensis TaxID=3981 RepID=A0A6A6LDX0_HEVBR|nr:hypothetical protein GH714_023765 [Hevea brasiliensis]